MLAGVGGWIFRAEQCRAKPLSVAKPKKKTDDGTAQEGRDEEQAYRSPCDQAHDQHADDNHQSDGMRCPLPGTVGAERHEMLRFGIGCAPG